MLRYEDMDDRSKIFLLWRLSITLTYHIDDGEYDLHYRMSLTWTRIHNVNQI